MRNLILLAALVGLSACDLPEFNLALPGLGGTKAESEIVVTRDNVTLSGPRGFCVDPQSSTRGPASAFVVFGNCAAISNSFTAAQPDVNAIVTSAVRQADPSLPKIENSSAQLDQFFNSDVGHILLSRSNDPKSVEVIESGSTAKGAFFVYVTDNSAGAPDGTENTYWRAYLDAKNSVVTVSVLSLDANPLTREEGLNILRRFSNSILSIPSNLPDPAPQLEETPAEQDATPSNQRPIARPDPTNVAEPKKTRTGILGRLFG